MKSVNLHPNIRYVSLSDDDGNFGLLLQHHDGVVMNVVEVHDKDEFSSVYEGMRSLCN